MGRPRTSGTFDQAGREMIWLVGQKRKKYAYTLKVEGILGKELPSNAVIHHIDGDNTNNSNSNLVICENQAYHMLIHHRQRILNAGGDPNTQTICGKCKEVKDLNKFYTQKSGRKAGSPTSYCIACITHLDSLRPPRR